MAEFTPTWQEDNMFPLMFKAADHVEKMMKVAEEYDEIYRKFWTLLSIILSNEEDYDNYTVED